MIDNQSSLTRELFPRHFLSTQPSGKTCPWTLHATAANKGI